MSARRSDGAAGDASTPAVRLLAEGADFLAPFQREDGELNDPVFGFPAQYGTAYFAYLSATLAKLGDPARAEERVGAARRALEATLSHLVVLEDPDPPSSNFTHDLGSMATRNLRDFMWPPVLRAYLVLADLGVDLAAVEDQLSRVSVPEVFSERAPVNWAAVWIAGEYLRMSLGRSPHAIEDLDRFLDGFFVAGAPADHGFYKELRLSTKSELSWESAIDVEAGVYREPGVPNSYDLFTRVHLMELAFAGYDGAWRGALERLAHTGLRRSLDLQLSSGSLPSAFRGSAHLWNLLAQCSLFFHGARLVEGDDAALASEADEAALRAFGAAQRCVRPGGGLSPVENVHPANRRVGHQDYTMDAHYVTLPLGFLCTAALDGFSGAGSPVERPAAIRVEPAPIRRSVVHANGISVHLNLAPQRGWDSLGIADVTFGLGRRLRFGGQTHYGRYDGEPLESGVGPRAGVLSSTRPFTLGIAQWKDRFRIEPISEKMPTGEVVLGGEDATLWAQAPLGELTYSIRLSIDGARVVISEDIGPTARCSLLVPYLFDRGDGVLTAVELTERAVLLTSGEEVIEVVAGGPVARAVHLANSYESRHGLCGLVRLDLEAPGPVTYEVRRVA